ncbi:hypothetical protein [Acuticoccus mangrovi]|uniref:Uncharacterized protein n=1 Tax=Acuticoccus mangrovi TaxID=2796142 RepID=A0A934IPN0_9HYPH|nr:hypothetical protein [Acuticoccus mangrovi]MBJ3776017.1 hypothetical protein [Acuticoccus mangrovi]
MRRLTALDAGTYYHHRTLYGLRFRDAFDRILYVRDLPRADLSDTDVLFVTCRTDPSVLVPNRAVFDAFLARGGTVVAMGSTGAHAWLPSVRWTDTATNFWWWKEGGSLDLHAVAPDHPFFGHVPLQDAIWHHHGFYDVPEGATSLIDVGDYGSVLYVDAVSSPGTMIVTALDPCYHHGSYFMPATTRFLDGFLPWLKAGQLVAEPAPA